MSRGASSSRDLLFTFLPLCARNFHGQFTRQITTNQDLSNTLFVRGRGTQYKSYPDISHGKRPVKWSGFFPFISLNTSAGDSLGLSRRVVYSNVQHNYSLP